VTILTIENGRVNALDLETMHELSAVLVSHASSAIVLTGSGSAFSAGVDLHRILSGGPDYTERFLNELSHGFRAVFDHPRPVVAAINGHAIAGGCVLAAACDARLMSKGRIGLTEIAVGVPLPIAVLEICRSAFGAAANRAALLADLYAPAEARDLGLIDREVAPADLHDEATLLARRLAGFAPEVYALAKRQLHRPAVLAMDSATVYEKEVLRQWASADVLMRIRTQLDSMASRRGTN
jgi:enoyl-CoA hydratase